MTTRRLAAILAADVAGYSRLMGADEEGTHERLKAHLRQLIDPKINEHRGRLVKNTGDGMLVEFSSVVDAVRCATEMQRGMADRNAEAPEDKRITFRVGINLGDVMVEPDDIYGHGVNIAARLEALAEPGGICISDDAFRQVRGKVDAEFIDMGEQELKNIARPVRTYRVGLGTNIQSLATPALALPDKPSIAVLPFANMSGDPEQEYFADGMVEEIITALSRIRWLFVIARNSSFTYKGQNVDVKRVGRELGVRYVLEGSVRNAGGRVRITAQLIEAETGAHLWSDRFDGSMEDVFDLQDRVAISVAGVIEPTLHAAEVRRAGRRPTDDLSAYDRYLRALPEVLSAEKVRTLRALDLLGQALESDPRYAAAAALASLCHQFLSVCGWAENDEANRDKGLALARRALRIGDSDPVVLANTAYVLAYFGEDISAAISLVERCLEFNPSYARAWNRSGWLRMWAGQADVAVEHFEKAARLSPLELNAHNLVALGAAHFFAGRFEEAREMLLRSLQEEPNWVPTYRFLAACYGRIRRIEEAREIISRLRPLTTVIVPDATHFRDPEQREMYLSGIRLAIGEAE